MKCDCGGQLQVVETRFRIMRIKNNLKYIHRCRWCVQCHKYFRTIEITTEDFKKISKEGGIQEV